MDTGEGNPRYNWEFAHVPSETAAHEAGDDSNGINPILSSPISGAQLRIINNVVHQINLAVSQSHLELNDPSGLQFSSRLQKIIPQSNNVRLDGTIAPNAFHGRAGFSEAHEKLLTLADGGLDGANIPLQPLLVKARGIRAIIAHDATADKEDNFADGISMIAESQRATCGRVRFFPCGRPVDGRMGMLGTRDPGNPSGAS
ncbi:hypothetical protein B0H13DRAFT_1874234 [Mycena leptocephala]|nr:hypothetical protein B0H13DRAFT_1874234 [Mycena leptocephala]